MPASDVGASRGPSQNRFGPRVIALANLALHRGAAGLMLVLAVLAALVFCRESFAAEPGDVTSGALMMRAKGGDQVVEAVRLGTDIDMTVSGLTVRTRVTQAFRNDTGHWVEAVYVYPLPDDGGVDTLKMVVGNKVIVGEIKKKAEAQAIYDAAKAQGKKAALVEQGRPNMFTNSVANVAPGETVLVQIEYQAPVAVSAGDYSLRVPLVVAPRYTSPGAPAAPDAAAPVVDPRVHGKINPVTITVHLRAGFPLAGVSSATHALDVRDERGGKRITLASGQVPADRDFVLTWRAAPLTAPAVGLFHEKVAGDDYVLAQLTPPIAARATTPAPRDIVFVIDNSGSMGGESMQQAKASLAYGLAHLKPGDRFNVVRFDDTVTVLFPSAVSADAAHLAKAQDYVASLDADGGTEMIPAMAAALKDDHAGETGRVRQVVFLTDGAIGDEQGLFDTISANRGRSRVFMVGIGSAPNTYLMSRAAELGRGTFTHIGSTDGVEGAMRQLFDKLESPVATNLAVTFEGAEVDLAPAVLPDLYRGEPITVAARVGAMKGVLRISGMIDGKPWETRIPLKDAEAGKGISKLWARRKVTDAEVARSLAQISEEDADARVLKLGLDHQLVTSQTSLVAVDKTPSRPADAPLTRADLPLNLPAGWDFDVLFGGARHPGADGQADADADQQVAGLDLPQTATDGPLLVMVGLGLLALGGLLGAGGWVLSGRRNAA
ncbi:marine proteobacterial sortase target protein [Caulobacter rhizosphaerae]|jgi:Ca-activated chloride channel family protein|uniref:marine proteobacterial sortase target protein n=1 Tax=Caulobacter rhizosphaerae TaxID=2010972 RepID=UPI0013D6CCB9|nr:marine proteobacterial sortase target protein [Caulobacter rhizosphaerae]GGL28731.1 marine proteobacterial sortase target protein [Caulobacter rhizosphaerae]